MKSIVAALLVAAVLGGCISRMSRRRELTGTCDGACAHYIDCKPTHPEEDRARCVAECPDVLRDEDSLMAYESLSCTDAVEYIDGSPQTARPART